MGKEQQDPYYDRQSRRDSQEILFWVGLACAAMLCVVVCAQVLKYLGIIHSIPWVR